MNERRVVIMKGATGEELGATLLLCPECNGETFHVFFPDGVDHSHFQWAGCGITFCDGCEDLEQRPVGDREIR